MAVKIVVVCGNTSPGGHTQTLAKVAAAAVKEAGAEVRFLDLSETRLPLADHADRSLFDRPEVKQVRESAAWADGFILATPEYHGSLSGALKNWFDYLYPELAGKLAGVMATTGGGGGDMSIVAAKTSFQWCHGWVLPFHVAAKKADFEDGNLADDKVRDRVVRLANDVVRYTAVLREAFESAKELGKGPEAGFAGFHVKG